MAGPPVASLTKTIKLLTCAAHAQGTMGWRKRNDLLVLSLVSHDIIFFLGEAKERKVSYMVHHLACAAKRQQPIRCNEANAQRVALVTWLFKHDGSTWPVDGGPFELQTVPSYDDTIKNLRGNTSPLTYSSRPRKCACLTGGPILRTGPRPPQPVLRWLGCR